MVEEGESVEEAALRELREETGYSADIISIREGLPKSAGLTSESTSLVFCETDEIAWSEPDMDDTEEITSMWMKPSVFFDFIKGVDPNKVRVAYDTYCYMLGTQLGDL